LRRMYPSPRGAKRPRRPGMRRGAEARSLQQPKGDECSRSRCRRRAVGDSGHDEGVLPELWVTPRAECWRSHARPGSDGVLRARPRGCGPGLRPDSGCYLSAARGLAAGRGCIPFSGHPFVEWPPLYPALLALLARCGAEPIVAARWLNAVLFGLILFVGGSWIRRSVRSLLVRSVGVIALLTATPLQLSSCYA